MPFAQLWGEHYFSRIILRTKLIAVVVAAARLLWCSQFPFSRLGICFPRTDIPRSCSQNAFVMLVGSCVCNGGGNSSHGRGGRQRKNPPFKMEKKSNKLSWHCRRCLIMFVGVANYCAQGQWELMDEVFFSFALLNNWKIKSCLLAKIAFLSFYSLPRGVIAARETAN